MEIDSWQEKARQLQAPFAHSGEMAGPHSIQDAIGNCWLGHSGDLQIEEAELTQLLPSFAM
ncbi:MAG: hypothetical protein FRX49_00205 [Trebouxia sp. A1-2]|nr:MAG: hypothetical protein FRX49_00205 [Trebouxia sp. A1-2]